MIGCFSQSFPNGRVHDDFLDAFFTFFNAVRPLGSEITLLSNDFVKVSLPLPLVLLTVLMSIFSKLFLYILTILMLSLAIDPTVTRRCFLKQLASFISNLTLASGAFSFGVIFFSLHLLLPRILTGSAESEVTWLDSAAHREIYTNSGRARILELLV